MLRLVPGQIEFRALLLASAAAGLALLAGVGVASERPNILLIFTDDQGVNDVGCYGSEIPTPHIDRLAEEGIKFTSWYSASSICTPSRYGLLTGKNPSRSRDRLLSALMFMGEEDAGRGIRRDESTIAEVLRDAGYDTALIGKWHLGHGDEKFLPVNHGFDTFIGHTGGCIDFFTMTYGIIPDWYHQTEHVSENGYATDLISEEAVRYLGARESDEGGQPFFMYLAYNAPHFGKGWSPKDRAPVNIMQAKAADLKRMAHIEDKVRREFAAMVVSLDDGIGKVLRALEENGQAKDTLVIFLTDHGGDPVYGGSNLPLRGDKATLFEGGIRVPCLMRWPGGAIRPGSISETPASSLDLFPTLCALAGVDASAHRPDGIDLSGRIAGDANREGDAGREFFWELGKHAELDRSQWTALRRGKWKLVQSPKDGEMLFDLSEDPNEKTDISLRNPEVFAELQARRHTLQQQYLGLAD